MAMIFGVPIEGSSWSEIFNRLEAGDRLWIVTANPEILLEAKRNAAYQKALKEADLRVVDGFGLFMATALKRLTGVELANHLVSYAVEKRLRVGLLGGEFGEAQAAAAALKAANPMLLARAEQGGRVARDGGEDMDSEEARVRMMQFNPQILFVAFGHPRQEFWIAKHRRDFPELKAVVGVGGIFNYWSKRIRRAPALLCAVGLEWLWRLALEPRRWRRIFKALIIFPILFFVERLFPSSPTSRRSQTRL